MTRRHLLLNSKYIYDAIFDFSFTMSRTVINYMVWRAIQKRASLLHKQFRDAKTEFDRNIRGSEKEPPRWKFCTSLVRKQMNMAAGFLYIDKYFPAESKKLVKMRLQEII